MIVELGHVVDEVLRSFGIRIMLNFDEILLIHRIAKFKLCYIFNKFFIFVANFCFPALV